MENVNLFLIHQADKNSLKIQLQITFREGAGMLGEGKMKRRSITTSPVAQHAEFPHVPFEF